MIRTATASVNRVGLRVGGTIAATLALLLVILALIRPEMGMAMLHTVMSAAGF